MNRQVNRKSKAKFTFYDIVKEKNEQKSKKNKLSKKIISHKQRDKNKWLRSKVKKTPRRKIAADTNALNAT